jgi:Fe-S-cluster containining protein
MTADVHWSEITPENEAKIMDQLKWFNLHRCDTNLISYKDGKKRAVLRIPILCRDLDQDKDGKFFCKHYDTRPMLCREFLCERAKQGMPAK